MFRQIKKDNKIGFSFVGLSLNNLVVRESAPVDEFYINKTVSSDDGNECVGFTDPIRMLFNQERLNRIGSTAVEAWLDSLVSHKKDPLKELRSQCSDKELKQLIKSRHIQQPCEIVAWAQMMEQNMEDFKSEVAKLEAEQHVSQVIEPVIEPITEPSKTE